MAVPVHEAYPSGYPDISRPLLISYTVGLCKLPTSI